MARCRPSASKAQASISFDVANLLATVLVGASKVFEQKLIGTSKVLARCVGPSKVLENCLLQSL